MSIRRCRSKPSLAESRTIASSLDVYPGYEEELIASLAHDLHQRQGSIEQQHDARKPRRWDDSHTAEMEEPKTMSQEELRYHQRLMELWKRQEEDTARQRQSLHDDNAPAVSACQGDQDPQQYIELRKVQSALCSGARQHSTRVPTEPPRPRLTAEALAALQRGDPALAVASTTSDKTLKHQNHQDLESILDSLVDCDAFDTKCHRQARARSERERVRSSTRARPEVTPTTSADSPHNVPTTPMEVKCAVAESIAGNNAKERTTSDGTGVRATSTSSHRIAN